MHGRLLYAASDQAADMFYATGVWTPDPFLFVQEPSGRRHVVISALEIDRVRRTARAIDAIHDWEPLRQRHLRENPEQTPETPELICRFLREINLNHVIVPRDFPLAVADTLRQDGVVVATATGSFWPEREHKRPDEVRAIQEALGITGRAMQAGIGLIIASSIGEDGLLHLDGVPLTSERVRARIHGALAEEGAVGRHTIVAGGAQGADPHEPGSGPLPAHWPIILDIFPRVERSGYWGDMTRTVCRGQPTERLQQAWEAVRQAQELACSMIRPGVMSSEVHAAVSRLLTERGFPTGPTTDGRQGGFFHGTGHGLGLEIHEAPRIGVKGQTLEAGQVVTVEPGLYYPEMGGVRLEDVVVVEAGGCRNLTEFPKYLVV
ncbi:MAG: aminopeptidase P family protein [Magnetococcales bacterium]|nr:aminopeptidase P family protein [Magnetococcales bacterium]